VIPLKRVRGNRRAFQEFAEAFESGSTEEPGLRAAIAHADAQERAEALQELVRRTRPQAQLDLVTMLGPVVGTHAGPGTVGLFWFDDG
jgi:fatty acid-binding protein DegV